MKSFLKFLLIVGGILFLSAVLAPILFKFLPFKFEKIFNRLVMIFSLASIFIFVRMDREKLAGYGLYGAPRIPALLTAGFAGGFLTLVLVTFVKLAAGAARFEMEPLSWEWILKPLSVLFSAFLIGLIEEFFFRGVVYQSMVRQFRWPVWASVLGTSVFYSIVHFVSVKKPFIGPDPGIADSLKLVAAPLASLAGWPEFWRGAVGLLIFGVVLNLLSIRSRSLFMSIGLHAGCVFFVKLDGFMVEFSNHAPLLWGSAKMYDSISGWIALTLMGFLLVWAAGRLAPERIRGKE